MNESSKIQMVPDDKELIDVMGVENLPAVWTQDEEMTDYVMFAVVIDGKPFAGICENHLYELYTAIVDLTGCDPMKLVDIYAEALLSHELSTGTVSSDKFRYQEFKHIIEDTADKYKYWLENHPAAEVTN